MHQMSIDSVHWGDWMRVGGLFWRTPQRCHQQEKWSSCTCPLQPSQLYTGGHEGCCIECRLSQPGIVSKRQKMIFGWSFLKNGTVGRSGLNQDFIFMWITHLLMIYEINHIWTAEMKWKWRNDHCSEHNLLHKEAWKKNSGLQRGLNPWPCDIGAMLYQLSYEATDIGSRLHSQWLHSSVGRASHRYREVTDSNPVEVLNFFSGSFTQLHKLRSLPRSFLHFHNYSLVAYLGAGMCCHTGRKKGGQWSKHAALQVMCDAE